MKALTTNIEKEKKRLLLIEELKLELERKFQKTNKSGTIDFYKNWKFLYTKKYTNSRQRDNLIEDFLKAIKKLKPKENTFHYIIKDVQLFEKNTSYTRYLRKEGKPKEEPDEEYKPITRPKAEYSNQRGYDYV